MMATKGADRAAGRRQAQGLSNPKRITPRQVDPYVARRPKGGLAVCPGCHAIFEKKRWHLDEPRYQELTRKRAAEVRTCPACRKIKDRYTEGIMTLKWAGLRAHGEEVRNLLRQEEARARRVNPLERIMDIKQNRSEWQVTTTNVTLAQRLGNELERAFHGKAHYHWAHGDKLAHVVWEREE
jgi:NMD protein affecting ribosome stability and mRNA decay